MFKFIQEFKANRATKKRLAELEREKKAQLDHWYLLAMIEMVYTKQYFPHRPEEINCIANVYINRYYKTVKVTLTGRTHHTLPEIDTAKLFSSMDLADRNELIELLKENKIKGYY